jgi:hypothetical protein
MISFDVQVETNLIPLLQDHNIEKGVDFQFGRHSLTPLLLNSNAQGIIFVCSTNPISRFAHLLLHHRE